MGRLLFLLLHYLFLIAEVVSSENSSGPKREPWPKSKKGYSVEEKAELIRVHNTYRSQCGAIFMRALTWDYELEALAQTVAENCTFKHTGMVSVGEWSKVGENLYAAKGFNVSKPVHRWGQENQHYKYREMRCEEGEQCGHYIQLVWDSTQKLGCGVSFCPILHNTKVRDMWFAVCEYGPLGNYPGQHPFTKLSWIKPCSDCPLDQPACDDKLQICVDPTCGNKHCLNGGVLISDVCLCNCSNTGFIGDRCEERDPDYNGEDLSDDMEETGVEGSSQTELMRMWHSLFQWGVKALDESNNEEEKETEQGESGSAD